MQQILRGAVCVATVCVLAISPLPVRAGSTNVVISEFRTRGPAGANDEFVELYNLSAATVSIGGWKIKGSSNAGAIGTRATVPTGTMLGPGCHFLLTNSSLSGGPFSGTPSGDQTYASGIADDGGVALTLPDDSIVDQVGMGAGSAFKEGTTLAPLTTNTDRGYERKPGGIAGSGADSDNNGNDFALLAPSDPQNLTSGCIAPTATATASVTASETATPSVTATVTMTITETGTVTPSATPTHSATTTATQTDTPSATATRTETVTATAVHTPSNTVTETPSETPTHSATATATQTDTPSATATRTETVTATAVHTPSNTATETPSETPTPSSTASATQTNTPTTTATSTATVTATGTLTVANTSTLTPTPTASQTPTVTCTSTPVATLIRTPSATPSATGTVAPGCGNGTLEPGEECDDGNLLSGDACPSHLGDACRYGASGALIRGNRRDAAHQGRSCQVEWYVVNPHQPLDRLGWRDSQQICTDQDDSCDRDPAPGRCRFQVVVCLNNEDRNLAACEPRGVRRVRVLRPAPARARIAELGGVLETDRLALDTALHHLRDPSSPSDGYPHQPPLSAWQRNFCSAPFAIDVFLAGLRERSVALTTWSFDDASEPRAQASGIRLTCRLPARR